MSGWVRYSRGRAVYRGRITRAPFTAWLESPDGRAVVDAAVSQMRFRMFARSRAVRRLWRQLAAAARDRGVAVCIQSEVDAYLERLKDFAYADGLPRTGIDLHRLVVVPRVLVNAATHGAIARRLTAQPAFASLDGGDPLREFFVLTLVNDLDATIAGARPTPKRPLEAGRDWISVGLNSDFAWRLPLLGEPQWNGHHYVLELTREPITRAVRKAVGLQMEKIEASLPALSRVERNEILRRALAGPAAAPRRTPGYQVRS